MVTYFVLEEILKFFTSLIRVDDIAIYFNTEQNKVGDIDVKWGNAELNTAHVKFHISVSDSGENVLRLGQVTELKVDLGFIILQMNLKLQEGK